MKKICLIFGGTSCEHEVSRVSAVNILKNLDKLKYEPLVMEMTKDNQFYIYKYDGKSDNKDLEDNKNLEDNEYYKDFLLKIVDVDNDLEKEAIIPDLKMFERLEVDAVFPIIHGFKGEDGLLQGFLDLCDVPYVGCDVLSSAVCMEKVLCKDILMQNGIAVADYLWFDWDEINENIKGVLREVEGKFAYPVFVKPSQSGSSVGINKAKDREQLEKALVYAAQYSRKVLVEEFLQGKELEVAVLGDYKDIKSTSVGEILPSNEFYDYKAKYIDNKSETILKADIPSSASREIKKIAKKAFKVLGCYGMARVDFFLTNGQKAIINEINTIPGFTGISMYPKLWEEAGLSYGQLLDELIRLAIERKNKYVFKTHYEEEDYA